MKKKKIKDEGKDRVKKGMYKQERTLIVETEASPFQMEEDSETEKFDATSYATNKTGMLKQKRPKISPK